MTRCAPLLRLAAALSLAFLAACDGGGGGGTGPSTSGMRLAPFSGDAQRGVPGRPLRSPVAVRVTREDGSPVEGVAVRFTPGPDAGEVEVVAGTTNAQGVASAVWTLGGAAPPLRLTATVDAAGVSPGSVTFTAGLLGDSEVDVLAFRGAGDALPIRLLGYRTGAISTGLRWTLTDTTLRIIPFDAADAPDEMVAFAPGMAPGMATGIRWTDRPDTVTLRVRSPVRVPLSVFIVSGDRDAQMALARAHVARAVAIWRDQGGILFDPVEYVDATEHPVAQEFRTTIVGVPCSSGLDAVGRPEGRISVYYVASMASFSGYGCGPRFTVISGGTGGLTNLLAHELGHVLGLYHEAFGQQNVMNPDVSGTDIGVGTELTAGQVFHAHYGSESAMVATYGATPAGQARPCRAPNFALLPGCPQPTLTLTGN